MEIASEVRARIQTCQEEIKFHVASIDFSPSLLDRKALEGEMPQICKQQNGL